MEVRRWAMKMIYLMTPWADNLYLFPFFVCKSFLTRFDEVDLYQRDDYVRHRVLLSVPCCRFLLLSRPSWSNYALHISRIGSTLPVVLMSLRCCLSCPLHSPHILCFLCSTRHHACSSITYCMVRSGSAFWQYADPVVHAYLMQQVVQVKGIVAICNQAEQTIKLNNNQAAKRSNCNQ